MALSAAARAQWEGSFGFSLECVNDQENDLWFYWRLVQYNKKISSIEGKCETEKHCFI